MNQLSQEIRSIGVAAGAWMALHRDQEAAHISIPLRKLRRKISHVPRTTEISRTRGFSPMRMSISAANACISVPAQNSSMSPYPSSGSRTAQDAATCPGRPNLL